MGDNNPQVVEAKRPASVDEIRLELARLAACPQRRAVWLGQARRRLYGTHTDPADAIQEALTRCLKAPEKYDATLGEVAVWVGNTLETVLTTMRRRHLRRAEDFDEARLAQARAVSEGPERLAQLRESLEYLRARRLLGERFASIIGATELDGRSMRNLADEMGTSEGSLNTYKSKQRNRLKEHQPHLLSLLPLVFLPGADGANARRSLWVWVARGKQALVTALATAAVVVPVTAHLTTRAVRNAMPRAAMVAPVTPAPAPVAPIAASPLYARPADLPVEEESDVMLAVARTPVEPSQTATASGPREVIPAALRAQGARQHIDDAVSSLDAGHPRLALRHIDDAARLAPQVEPALRESRRCLALHALGRRSDAEACARGHLTRWPSSIFAAQMGQVLSPR
jgi:DNA-directed RNA polymerase specialized sigma24 family protein